MLHFKIIGVTWFGLCLAEAAVFGFQLWSKLSDRHYGFGSGFHDTAFWFSQFFVEVFLLGGAIIGFGLLRFRHWAVVCTRCTSVLLLLYCLGYVLMSHSDVASLAAGILGVVFAGYSLFVVWRFRLEDRIAQSEVAFGSVNAPIPKKMADAHDRAIVSMLEEGIANVSQPKTEAEAFSKDDIKAFVQTRTYYYLPKWNVLDPTLRHVAPGTFNWAACILTVFWLAYRKMYLFTAIWLAFLCVFYSVVELVFSLPASAMNGANIAMMLLFGRYGSSLYRKHVERKVREVKSTMAHEYWTEAFKDKGGTSLLAPIPLVILHLLTLYGVYLSIVEKTTH